MGRAFFVCEDAIDFCYDYVTLRNIYCQEVADPSCETYDSLEALKDCLRMYHTEKHILDIEIEQMCKALKGTEFENICQGD